MHGIVLESGINDCHWNIEGKCTNKTITRNQVPASFSRDWDSKQNCTMTQIGVLLCSCYYQESAAEGCKTVTKNMHFSLQTMKIIGDITRVNKKEVIVDIGSSTIGWYSLRIPRRDLPDHPRTGQRLMLTLIYQGPKEARRLAGFNLEKPVMLLPALPQKRKPKSDLPPGPKDYNDKSFQKYVGQLREFFHERPRKWM